MKKQEIGYNLPFLSACKKLEKNCEQGGIEKILPSRFETLIQIGFNPCPICLPMTILIRMILRTCLALAGTEAMKGAGSG